MFSFGNMFKFPNGKVKKDSVPRANLIYDSLRTRPIYWQPCLDLSSKGYGLKYTNIHPYWNRTDDIEVNCYATFYTMVSDGTANQLMIYTSSTSMLGIYYVRASGVYKVILTINGVSNECQYTVQNDGDIHKITVKLIRGTQDLEELYIDGVKVAEYLRTSETSGQSVALS